MAMVSVHANGKVYKMILMPTVSYEQLCATVGRPTDGCMTVTYSMPDGSCGTVLPKQFAPLGEGAVYNICNTNNA
jgi:hypothetical protein